MDWSDNAEQAEFRAKVAGVITTKLPERYKDGEGDEEGAGWEADRISANPDAQKAASDWAGALAEHGWVAPHWPKEYGGAGLTPMEQFIFKMEMAKAAAPTVGGQGVSQLGPTLIVHGTPEQKEEHLTKILDGSANWRQGYSEPGAGSDLASLQTRAIRDGDEYVLNGQKIWTSGAQYPDHRLQRDVLRGRPRPGEGPRGRGEPGLVRRHDAARLRAVEHHRRRERPPHPGRPA